MKRILLAAAAWIMVLSAVSCRKEPNNPPKEDTMATEYNSCTNGGAYYYGTWNDKVNVFCTYLMTGQTRIDDGVISGIGTALWLDLNTEINADNTIPSNTYGLARNEDALGFFSGQIEETEISGSYIYYRSLNGTAEYRMIRNGQVSFNTSGGRMKITAEVIDEEGVTFTFRYEGYFSYEDVVVEDPDPDPDPNPDPVNYTLNDFTYGYIWDFENAYGDDYNPHKIFRVCLADSNFNLDTLEGEGKELQLEFTTSADATDIIGDYEVKFSDFPEKTADINSFLAPGNALCAYEEMNNDGGYDKYGTWFFPDTDEQKWTGATSGKLSITKKGTDYNVSFDFADSYMNTTFKGSYTGPLTNKSSQSNVRRENVRSSHRPAASRQRTAERSALTAVKALR